MLHDQIALPMRISALLSTIVNRLPASASLDRVDLNGSSRAPVRSARSNAKSASDDIQPRFLVGELAGFAASDAEIIKILESLSSMHPFEDITLDFTRTRTVRGHSAREFRISFRVNLDSAYEERVAAHPEPAQPQDRFAAELTQALDATDE